MDSATDITRVLDEAGKGDPQARDRLLRLVYGELRHVAARHMRRERIDHTLQPTALVHEVYMRLFGHGEMRWQDRGHFIRCSARAMRQILVDHARKARRAKRGGDAPKVSMHDSAVVTCDQRPDILLALDDSLDRLHALDARQAEIVEMLYFTGLTQKEAAETLGLSEITVRREWRLARAWLRNEISGATPP